MPELMMLDNTAGLVITGISLAIFVLMLVSLGTGRGRGGGLPGM